jgi:hypothetical protein
VWVYTPVIPVLGRLKRKIMSSRPAWVTQQVCSQPGLQNVMMSSKQNFFKEFKNANSECVNL